jgi:hypothetical protein
MLFGRRMIILVAVLMGLVALAASVAPPPRTDRGPAAGSTPTPSATPAATLPPDASGPGVETRRVDATRHGPPVTILVRQGTTLDLQVDVGAPDTVVLGDLKLEAATEASPAQFELYADRTGEYPLRLLGAGRVLGVVRVSAASAAR